MSDGGVDAADESRVRGELPAAVEGRPAAVEGRPARDDAWRPAAPSRPADYGRTVGASPEAAPIATRAVPRAVDHGGPKAAAARPRGRLLRAWFRISGGPKLATSYAALALVVTLVAVVGGGLQPHYGSSSPWQGVAVDDLRAAPQTGSWAVDLAGRLAPGAPSQCVRFVGQDVGPDLTVVRAESAWIFGYSDDGLCASMPSGFRSRLALLDTSTGTVRWVHDSSDDVTSPDDSAATPRGGYPVEQSQQSGVALAGVSVVDDGRLLLVRAGTDSRSILETISVATGRVHQSTGPSGWGPEDRYAASGDVVATGHRSDDLLSYVFELRDVHDLDRIVWSGRGDESSTMIALPDRLLLGDVGTRQIPLSTGVASAWGVGVDTTLGYAVEGGTVFAARATGARGAAGSGARTDTRGSAAASRADSAGFAAVASNGTTLWTSDLDLRGSYSLSRSCLTVTNRVGDELTCLDYATGEARWSDAIGPFSFAGGAVGQRSDDVFAVAATADPTISSIDARTGRVRFETPIPSGATLVAAGRTVGYVLGYGVSGARSTVTAIDLSSGKRLWVHSAGQQLGVWGGHLIDVGSDGLVRRLTE